jgi:two-component system sensor histidine kinase DctS
MGLAICRSIIEAHQGVLDASDTASGGALFSFSLPLSRESVHG